MTERSSTGPVLCAICGGTAVPRGVVPGYREPDVFTVVECGGCRASFAQPLAVDASIYEQVYRHRQQTPGYARYERMADEVAKLPDPLAWLQQKEAMYWAVATALRELPRGARVLEIGSGLGYTTHALATAGFDAHGIDLSHEAVGHAVRRFGPRYRQGDAMQIAQQEQGTWDALIATELIEHLVDPVAFVAGIRPLLRPGGRIVLTTPDKDIYRPGTLWQSDLPPVHLWWFGADSMRKLAERVGMSMQLLDFSEYHRAKPDAARVLWPAGEVLPQPRLRADGTPSAEAEPHGMARYFPQQHIGWRQRLRWLLYQCTPGRRPPLTRRARTMGIVLQSTAS